MKKRDWIEWGRTAGVRAVKTFAQSALAAVTSLLMSLKGLPELDK